jgi:hypothetical protein
MFTPSEMRSIMLTMRPGYSRRRSLTELERFELKQVKHSGDKCWDWLGSIDPGSGYGQFFVIRDGRQTKVHAHRYSYQLVHGEIPDGVHVLHRCGDKLCTNPAHLYAGDPVQNAHDAKVAGAITGRRLTEDEALAIVSMREAGATYEQLAHLCGVSHQAIRNVCRGVTHSATTGISPT